jgi:uncharacterized protein (DUF3820 family)
MYPQNKIMNHSDAMPWGVHKGKPIGEVPFDYLWKFYKKMWLGGDVLRYFEDQLQALEHSEQETAPLLGKKPKTYRIDDYKCCYPDK